MSVTEMDSVLHSFQTVEYGVFHDRLKDHFGDGAVQQLRRHFHREGEGAGEADALDLHISLEDLQFPAQRDKFLR